MRTVFLLLALAAFATPAAADTLKDGAPCARYKWPLETETALLQAPAETVASGAALSADRSVGAAFVVELSPATTVDFAVEPERKAESPDAFAGIVALNLPAAGAYQVSLSEAAWIDVIQNGAAVSSSDHTGEGGCPVRKSVRFTLAKGAAILQISRAEAEKISVVITPSETGHENH